ncbi:MAG: FAD-binding oxidoreductase [Acidimicrobiales bacterium]|jgi:glycine/D-amino acid oxidase-like deaminating enzyme|nr:FAD-binding oxidoreductase [Acidimicrobiales bacterium]|tara:strand:+ start:9149 stop:10333 length:1185 start_codon:yes stop_codon:yes gene_type:complete
MPADRFDTIIVGGAVIGSAVAYFLSENPDYTGTVLVVEPDPTYALSSTTLSCASIRHQFSNPVNVELSLFGTQFLNDFNDLVEVGGESPDLCYRDTGYLFLAPESGWATLEANHQIQSACGADIILMDREQLGQRFPYLAVDDLSGGSIGVSGEGTFDAFALMWGLRQRARHNGVDYTTDRVVDLQVEDNRVLAVQLESGRTVQCSHVVNAAGPRSATIADMAGIPLPVEARNRSVFVFDAAEPAERNLPMIVDPSGVYVRSEPPYFLAGAPPTDDVAVDADDLTVVHEEFEDLIWPVLAERIPSFDRLRVTHSWAGHYAYNVIDQNAVVGPAHPVENLILANGFSGHGLQQAPGVGRAVAELLTYGEYTSIDLSQLGYARIAAGKPFQESAII